MWARTLHAVENSRLLMRTHGLGDPKVCESIIARFSQQGIEAERLELLDGCQHVDLLNSYNRVDIALDSYPYSGGLTTCEALWMGVPVVSLGEERFASLHSTSHLFNAGVSELIAQDAEDYIKIASKLSSDLTQLSTMRARLRHQTAESPLCDGPRYATSFRDFIRSVWQRYCSQDDA